MPIVAQGSIFGVAVYGWLEQSQQGDPSAFLRILVVGFLLVYSSLYELQSKLLEGGDAEDYYGGY